MTTDLLILFGIHYLSDFLLQTREMGKKKSEDFKFLSQHTIIIFSTFFLVGTLILNTGMILFSFLYAIIHDLQDWYIWRGYKHMVWKRLRKAGLYTCTDNDLKIHVLDGFKYWEDSKFYATIGLDQTLHFITIVLIYNWVV